MAEAADTVLSDSLQDYLEAVYLLVRRDRVARMKEIAAHLGVGKSSATGAIQALADRGLVNYDPYRFVTLTERGQAAGREILRRHEILKDFLVKVLAVESGEAEAVACKMEHAIKGDVLGRFLRFLRFAEERSRDDAAWAQALRSPGEDGAPAGEETNT